MTTSGHYIEAYGGRLHIVGNFSFRWTRELLGAPDQRYDSESLLATLKSYDASNWVEVNAATWDKNSFRRRAEIPVSISPKTLSWINFPELL